MTESNIKTENYIIEMIIASESYITENRRASFIKAVQFA